MTPVVPLILRIAVPVPLRHLFDYLPADSGQVAPLPGCRVWVPFGRTRRLGVVVECVSGEPGVKGRRLRAIEAVVDQAPVFSPANLALLRWVSAYYHHPIGETLHTALPVALRDGEPARPSRVAVWRLSDAGRCLQAGQFRRARRQAAIWEALMATAQGLDRVELAELGGDPGSALRAMTAKGWVVRGEIDPWSQPPLQGEPPSAPSLNAEQGAAVEEVQAVMERFQCLLLDGVTGSGKTEVYLRLVATALERGRQVLVLVPEIGLTPQLVRRFRRRLPVAVAVLHSSMSARDRLNAWLAASAGKARVVIGTRSAVFVDLPDLGLVIVDEEHDASFKQQDGLRYHARDVAVVRARRAGVPVVLGSATPSLESLHNARSGRYRHLRLTRRAGNARPPAVQVVDLETGPQDDGLSEYALAAMRETLARGEQVLVFLNRRGFAPLLRCPACGWIAECKRCDARMTYHRGIDRLRCHHCGSERTVDRRCPNCGKAKPRPVGLGTERIEENLALRLPGQCVARVDRDSTRRSGALDDLLERARDGTAQVLVGTQMLAKGHHLPAVTLVTILDSDAGLYSADFRAPERLAQLIVQVAGRAGRAERPGRVLIQTRFPDHPLLAGLIHHGYGAFADGALAERAAAGFPPFAHQVLFRAESKRREAAMVFLRDVREILAGDGEVEVLGPAAAPMERLAGRYRARLLLQARQRGPLHRLLSDRLPRIEAVKTQVGLRWSLDVDPGDQM